VDVGKLFSRAEGRTSGGGRGEGEAGERGLGGGGGDSFGVGTLCGLDLEKCMYEERRREEVEGKGEKEEG
jgi:hypothetical protein